MTKEVINKATVVIETELNKQFCQATDRQCDYNDRILKDNPHSIAEELNTLLPWLFDKPEFHYEYREEEDVIISVLNE